MDLYGFFVKIDLIDAERVEPVEAVGLAVFPGLLQCLPTIPIDVCFLSIDRYGLAKRRVAVAVGYSEVFGAVCQFV